MVSYKRPKGHPLLHPWPGPHNKLSDPPVQIGHRSTQPSHVLPAFLPTSQHRSGQHRGSTSRHRSSIPTISQPTSSPNRSRLTRRHRPMAGGVLTDSLPCPHCVGPGICQGRCRWQVWMSTRTTARRPSIVGATNNAARTFYECLPLGVKAHQPLAVGSNAPLQRL